MKKALPVLQHKPISRTINNIAVVGMEGFLADYTTTNYRMPRIGPVIIGSLLDQAGYHVRIFAEAVKAITRTDLDYICACDFVAISVLTYGANRAYALCDLIRSVNPSARILMGDAHPTIMPEHCLAHCDYVIRGEGDEAIFELLDAINTTPQRPDLLGIDGLSFWHEGRIVHNPARKRPENIDIDIDLSLIESFVRPDALSVLMEGRMNLVVLQASRGCPVACEFCLGASILGTEYRTRDIERVIAALHRVRRLSIGKRPSVFFIDNHFFIDKQWTKALLRRIIAERLRFSYIAFGQYFVGRDPEMLDLLREAGFMRIFVGFESINPQTLKEYRKKQSESAMRECIAAMHDHGVEVHGSFMLGGETDTLDTLESTIRFAIDTDILTASFFGLCEYPFEQHDFVPTTNMLPRHRLLPDNLDYYNLNFVSIYPRLMRPSQLQRGLIDAHQRFYSPARALRTAATGNSRRAYHRLVGYLGQRVMFQQMRSYLPYLEERERGIYDAEDRLVEQRLLERSPIKFRNPRPSMFRNVYDGVVPFARFGDHDRTPSGTFAFSNAGV